MQPGGQLAPAIVDDAVGYLVVEVREELEQVGTRRVRDIAPEDRRMVSVDQLAPVCELIRRVPLVDRPAFAEQPGESAIADVVNDWSSALE